MIIQCNSCEKKFTVSDSAITANGRLVQCSSCGNQWTQYPVDQSLKKVNKTPKQQKRKKQKIIDTYSDEYLQKKHGIKIIDPSSVSETLNKTKSKSKELKKITVGFGFYSYLIVFFVLLLTMFGVLILAKEIIIYYFPFLENYINYLYETLDNLSLVISDIASDY